VKQKFELDNHQSDEMENQWIVKIRSGDAAAYEELFRQYYPRLCTFAEKIVQSKQIAEEIVQEIFLKIWEHKATWTPRCPINMYLYRAAKNISLNHLKHEKVVRDWEEEEIRNLSFEDSDPEKELYRNELSAAIRQAVDQLPERCRLTYILSRQEGLKYSEIAFVLNVSVKTVETQMGRALKTLRSLLSPYLH
jgi:RNA polymerase sigma-70 factor (ECF subfamily)